MPKESNTLEITPQTRLGPLLEAYPTLEEVLLELSPAFAKLTHPVLRRTIAKVATLRQVAEVGGIPLATLINQLRRKVGLEAVAVEPSSSGVDDAWYQRGRIVQSYDARPLLANGGHPLQRVLADIQKLKPGQVYELITPFVPAPLIEVVQKKGFRAQAQTIAPELVKTFIALSD